MQRVMWMYRKMYSGNGIPEAMLDGILVTVATQMKEVPILALSSAIASLRSQIK